MMYLLSNKRYVDYVHKEWWINIYDHYHDPRMYYHPSRAKAIVAAMRYKKPIYRIHVRLK